MNTFFALIKLRWLRFEMQKAKNKSIEIQKMEY